MNIILLGMKHCGKSTCAWALSKKLNLPFHDTDELMSELYREKYGKTLSAKQIFAEHGAEFFKQLEAEAVLIMAEDLQEDDDEVVLALGGATPTNGDIVGELKKADCLAVYLKASPEAIFSRVKNNGPSRFLQGDNPLENFIKISKEREAFYLKYADITIDTDAYSCVQDMVKGVTNIVCERIKQEL